MVCPRTSSATCATYGLEMTASYAGEKVRNPWGKASGQLSLNEAQINETAEAGLGFVVLKTVIARDAAGVQSMSAWAIKESRMIVEPIRSPTTGANGWTVTWKGRGWWQSFDDYLELVRAGCAIGRRSRTPRHPVGEIPPPGQRRSAMAGDEYVESTRTLVAAYRSGRRSWPDAAGKGLLADARRLGSCVSTRHRPRLAETGSPT